MRNHAQDDEFSHIKVGDLGMKRAQPALNDFTLWKNLSEHILKESGEQSLVMEISLCVCDADIDSLDRGYFGPELGNLRTKARDI